MRELGFTEGTNLVIEYRVRPGKPEEILALANDLVRAKVGAILAIAPPGVGAAAKATTSIPIVANDMESDSIARGTLQAWLAPEETSPGCSSIFPRWAASGFSC